MDDPLVSWAVRFLYPIGASFAAILIYLLARRIRAKNKVVGTIGYVLAGFLMAVAVIFFGWLLLSVIYVLFY